MTVICKNCGNHNDLGRIFCTKCGKRLELKAPDVEDAIRKGEGGFPVGKIVTALIVVLVVAGVGLAFWPMPAAPAAGPASPCAPRRARAAKSPPGSPA